MIEELLQDELETYKGKWVNLHVSTKGSFIGGYTYNSCEHAFHAIAEQNKAADERYLKGRKTDRKFGDLVKYTYPTDYITTIQMPVGEL